MKNLLSVILTFISITSLFSQNCYEGNLGFDTQEQLDQFIIDYPDVTCITGNVEIFFETGDLSGLSNITSINGNFWPWFVTAFNGMENLQHCESLYLESLPDVTALQSLTSTGFEVTWALNCLGGEALTNQLTEFYGVIWIEMVNSESINIFNNITSADHIFIQSIGNDSLDYLHGFENLQQVGNIECLQSNVISLPDFSNLETAQSLLIEGCSSLNAIPDMGHVTSLVELKISGSSFINLEGLMGLEEVTGSFMVQNCNNLIDLTGLDSLQYIGPGYNKIGHNNALQSFNGLGSLLHIGGPIWITNNQQLTDISALNHVVTVDGLFQVDNCGSLSNCDVLAICNLIATNPTMITLSNNTGCTSIDEVALMCGLSMAHGNVYVDLDNDMQIDTEDFFATSTSIINQQNTLIDITNSDGVFTGYLMPSTTMYLHAIGPQGYESSTTSFTATENTEVLLGDIFIHPTIANLHNLSVVVTSPTPPRPGFHNLYHIKATNYGVTTEDVVVQFDMLDMPGASIEDADGGSLVGNTITWANISLMPWQSAEYTVDILVSSSAELGTLYTSESSCHYTDNGLLDNFPLNNVYTTTQEVIGSFDPNDKTVNKSLLPSSELANPDGISLEYIIRFQNTGTAPAVNIVVEDMLEENLDASTLQMLNASHSYEFSIDEDGKLIWTFDNIMLPDSTANEVESHGFIHFKINTHADLSLTDSITNSCSIFFDFNLPIITNTATTVFFQCSENMEPSILSANGQLETELIPEATYQWYLNDQLLTGEANNFIVPSQAGSYMVQVVFENGCTYSSEPFGYVGISNLEPTNMVFTLWPNPATEQLNINILRSANQKVEVLDLLGNVLLQTTNTNSKCLIIDTSSMASGCYLVRLGLRAEVFIKQ